MKLEPSSQLYHVDETCDSCTVVFQSTEVERFDNITDLDQNKEYAFT